jgi:hypothetical protein
MTFDYQLDNRGNYVAVTTSGNQNANQVEPYILEIDKFCEAHGCNLVLLDERGLSVHTDIDHEVLLSDFVSFGHGLRHVSRIACVPSGQSRTTAIFFESLARSKHFNFKVFDTIDAAMEWLEG